MIHLRSIIKIQEKTLHGLKWVLLLVKFIIRLQRKVVLLAFLQVFAQTVGVGGHFMEEGTVGCFEYMVLQLIPLLMQNWLMLKVRFLIENPWEKIAFGPFEAVEGQVLESFSHRKFDWFMFHWLWLCSQSLETWNKMLVNLSINGNILLTNSMNIYSLGSCCKA